MLARAHELEDILRPLSDVLGGGDVVAKSRALVDGWIKLKRTKALLRKRGRHQQDKLWRMYIRQHNRRLKDEAITVLKERRDNAMDRIPKTAR